MSRSKVGVLAALVVALAVAALIARWSLTDGSSPHDARVVAAAPASDGAEPIVIRAVDYAFEGVPERVAVGTTVTLVNDSAVELHELVAIRIADDETRPVAELIELPDEELAGVIAEMPAMVLIAPPGSEGMAVVGDGTFTEPGRYALLCFIPTGADPQAYLAAAEAATDGPPQVEGGPPHVVHGMVAEVVVE